MILICMDLMHLGGSRVLRFQVPWSDDNKDLEHSWEDLNQRNLGAQVRSWPWLGGCVSLSYEPQP